MDERFAEALRTSTFEERRLLMRHQSAVGRLLDLELRDRWGYELGPAKLAAIADFVVLNLDHENLSVRNRASAVMVEIVDRLQLAMMTGDVPLFCDGYDEPPEDESVQEVITTMLAGTPPRKNPKNQEGSP